MSFEKKRIEKPTTVVRLSDGTTRQIPTPAIDKVAKKFATLGRGVVLEVIKEFVQTVAEEELKNSERNKDLGLEFADD